MWFEVQHEFTLYTSEALFCMLKRRRRQISSRVGYEPKDTLKSASFLGSGDAMSEGATSERTPESGGLRAIEDAGPADGVMALPAGPPVVLGPENWNPFWSESVRDEAVLRAIRPADLPQESLELQPVEVPQCKIVPLVKRL